MARPELTTRLDVKTFRDYYWLKEELVAFCRTQGITASGGKFAVADRIAVFLESGRVITSKDLKRVRISSSFNWSTETLTPETLITDSYKNNANVRAFFVSQVGPSFHFSIDLMDFMKAHHGEPLSKAVEEWRRLQAAKKAGYKPKIPFHNQYNRYLRDFLADNPDKTKADALRIWNLKKALPGDMTYSAADLKLSFRSTLMI